MRPIKRVNGLWLPAHESHLTYYAAQGKFGEWTYQAHKMIAALEFCRNARVAVDIGGHCGLWSKELTKVFNHVHAFEPVELHRECYERNVGGHYTLHACALGEGEGRVSIHTTDGSSGDSYVKGYGDIPLRTLDGFGLADVDFMKLDCEGYELYALRGGKETILRCRPVVIVEQKPGRAQKWGLKETEAVDFLEGLGMKLQKEIAGDFILTW